MPNRKEVPPKKVPAPGEGPPPARDLKAEIMRTYPMISVTLDAGAFMRLWRVVESQAYMHFSNAARTELLPEQGDVLLRTVDAFRSAYSGTQQRVYAEKPKRVIKKR